jgi:hypothetical protein
MGSDEIDRLQACSTVLPGNGTQRQTFCTHFVTSSAHSETRCGFQERLPLHCRNLPLYRREICRNLPPYCRNLPLYRQDSVGTFRCIVSNTRSSVSICYNFTIERSCVFSTAGFVGTFRCIVGTFRSIVGTFRCMCVEPSADSDHYA